MKRTVINIPKSSPATLVNLVITAEALKIARIKSIQAVQTQTLCQAKKTKLDQLVLRKKARRNKQNKLLSGMQYHAAQAKYRCSPRSSCPLANLYKYVYIITVGSATPTISRGCPPSIECMMPHIAVEAKVSTVLSLPSITGLIG